MKLTAVTLTDHEPDAYWRGPGVPTLARIEGDGFVFEETFLAATRARDWVYMVRNTPDTGLADEMARVAATLAEEVRAQGSVRVLYAWTKWLSEGPPGAEGLRRRCKPDAEALGRLMR